jgi:hypothetical protein
MPQTEQTNQQTKQDPLQFIIAHKSRLASMPIDKQVQFTDLVFDELLLPKYQKINQQKPLNEGETDRLRLQFHQRMLNLDGDQTTQLDESKEKPSGAKKAAAAAEGGGAGVLGGVKTMAELYKKVQDHLGVVGKPAGYVAGKVAKYAGKAEGKAYEDAQVIDPKIASVSAGIGHQIPAAITAGGVGEVLPAVGKGAALATKAAVGAGRGAAEGAAFEGARPGGDPQSGAIWGGLLGAAFPVLGKMFGLGKKAVSKGAVAATETPKSTGSLGEMHDLAAKEKFGKPFKDLTPAEKVQMPNLVKEQISKQRAAKAAEAKITKDAARASKEAQGEAVRASKAQAASDRAAKQAQRRASVPASTPAQKEAVATQAATENPSVAKIMAPGMEGFKPGEGTSAAAPGQALKTNPDQEIATAKHELEKNKGILRNPSATEEEKRVAQQNHDFWSEKLQPKPTKVPEGVEGKKIRAKEGKPASPAQQAADRERIAKTRELSKGEEFGKALEKHAQEMAGRHTVGSVGLMHVPELEEAMKEFPNGELFLRGFKKLKAQGRLTDELYMHEMKDWLLTQFEKEQ